jgi:hypothetical protein
MKINFSPGSSPFISIWTDVGERGLTENVIPAGNDVQVAGVGVGSGAVTVCFITAGVGIGTADGCPLAPASSTRQAEARPAKTIRSKINGLFVGTPLSFRSPPRHEEYIP